MDVVNLAFVLLWAGWLLFWLLSARGSKRTVSTSGPFWRLFVLAVIAFSVFMSRQSPAYFERPLLPASAARDEIGLVLTAVGLGFTIWARRVLGTNWSASPTIKQDHDLIQRGPYSLVRHPIYSGLLLALFGSCLAGGRMSHLWMFVVSTVLVIVKLKTEEALLAREFPDAYRDYRQRVKALVPFLL